MVQQNMTTLHHIDPSDQKTLVIVSFSESVKSTKYSVLAPNSVSHTVIYLESSTRLFKACLNYFLSV